MIGLIDDVSEIAQDESNAGVMAVMSIKDHFQDSAGAITFLKEILPNTKNEVVRRSIQIKLADFYQPKEAVAELAKLITGKS